MAADDDRSPVAFDELRDAELRVARVTCADLRRELAAVTAARDHLTDLVKELRADRLALTERIRVLESRLPS